VSRLLAIAALVLAITAYYRPSVTSEEVRQIADTAACELLEICEDEYAEDEWQPRWVGRTFFCTWTPGRPNDMTCEALSEEAYTSEYECIWSEWDRVQEIAGETPGDLATGGRVNCYQEFDA